MIFFLYVSRLQECVSNSGYQQTIRWLRRAGQL